MAVTPQADLQEMHRDAMTDECVGANGPLSILHIAAPAAFGGLESVLRALADGQRRRGDTVRVVPVLTPQRGPHPFVAMLESDAIDTRPLYVGARDYPGERRAVGRLCEELRPDVVHTHGFRPDVVDGAVARAHGIAVVSTCHGFIDSNRRGRAYQWLQRRALRRFDAVIAVATPIAERLRAAGVASERIHLVPNGFAPRRETVGRAEARRLLGLPDGLTVGWVGRFSREKGPELALEALALLGRPDVRLAMIGQGDDAATLHMHARALDVSTRVSWPGAVPEAGRLFAAFDAFLLSSRTEGTPIALLEAMAARVPIVATRVGGVPSIVDDTCAMLVPSGDAQGMARALAAVLDGSSEARTRADTAHARLLEQFAMEHWLERHDAIYRAILGSA